MHKNCWKKKQVTIWSKFQDFKFIFQSNFRSMAFVLHTVYPTKYSKCTKLCLLCYVFIFNFVIKFDILIHNLQGCFTDNGTFISLPQCQWNDPQPSIISVKSTRSKPQRGITKHRLCTWCWNCTVHATTFKLNIECRYNAAIFHTNIRKRHPFTQIFIKDTPFVDPASDWYSASVPVIIYEITYNIEPRYNNTQLYMCLSQLGDMSLKYGWWKYFRMMTSWYGNASNITDLLWG